MSAMHYAADVPSDAAPVILARTRCGAFHVEGGRTSDAAAVTCRSCLRLLAVDARRAAVPETSSATRAAWQDLADGLRVMLARLQPIAQILVTPELWTASCRGATTDARAEDIEAEAAEGVEAGSGRCGHCALCRRDAEIEAARASTWDSVPRVRRERPPGVVWRDLDAALRWTPTGGRSGAARSVTGAQLDRLRDGLGLTSAAENRADLAYGDVIAAQIRDRAIAAATEAEVGGELEPGHLRTALGLSASGYTRRSMRRGVVTVARLAVDWADLARDYGTSEAVLRAAVRRMRRRVRVELCVRGMLPMPARADAIGVEVRERMQQQRARGRAGEERAAT